jgi:hypothetical protein
MTDYTDLIERLRRPTITPSIFTCREAADALAAQAKRIEDVEADRTKLRTLLDCKREDIDALVKEREQHERIVASWLREEALWIEEFKEFNAALARVTELEVALRELLAYEPEHCACGDGNCTETKDAWECARAALAEGDKP